MAAGCPKMAQNGSKMAPRWPKMPLHGPRCFQLGPKRFPKDSKMSQDGPKSSLTKLQIAHDWQRCPKIGLLRPALVQLPAVRLALLCFALLMICICHFSCLVSSWLPQGPRKLKHTYGLSSRPCFSTLYAQANSADFAQLRKLRHCQRV